MVLIILAIRGLTLPGAGQGVQYYLTPGQQIQNEAIIFNNTQYLKAPTVLTLILTLSDLSLSAL